MEGGGTPLSALLPNGFVGAFVPAPSAVQLVLPVARAAQAPSLSVLTATVGSAATKEPEAPATCGGSLAGCLGVSLATAGVSAARNSKRRRKARVGGGSVRAHQVARLATRSSSEGPVWPLNPMDAKTLRQVVVVHRHGTRFPTKPTGAGNLSWPQRAAFWEKYKGHLTPVGNKQLQDVGDAFRERYIGEDGGLFKGCPQIDGRVIACYTSNIQRTLQSAWSFLMGLVPDASIFFTFRTERVFAGALRQSVGVPIYVEDATEGDDKLFHEWTIQPGYKKWLKENQHRSEFLRWAKDDPEYIALLDKLYETTNEPKLKPGKDPLDRLVGAKDVDTLVSIDESHKRPILANEYGEPLLPNEQEMLRKIGNEVKRCWFGDANGDVERSYGERGAAYLAHKIWRHMDERARSMSHLRLVEFSCHDTSMCALATHLGLELSEIGFGAFFAFELHEDTRGGHFVKFYYNSMPAGGRNTYARLKSVALPLGSLATLQKLDHCTPGQVSLDTFEQHCKVPEVEETFESFMDLLGRADLGPTRRDLETLLERGNTWLDFSEWKAHHHDSFLSFDKNKDGALCRPEMEKAVAEWYGISGKTVDLVFHLVDRNPDEDLLTEEDVYLAMCALVGMRGSISAKTAGTMSLPLSGEVIPDDNVHTRGAGGTTSLMSAANVGDVEHCRNLIAQGADVNASDDYGWTPLRYAVRKRDFATTSLLIEMDADVNKASKSGRTPLMSAVANRAPDIVQLLVDNGADPKAKNGDGISAIDIASRGGGMGSSVVRTLLSVAA
mmetsp:Transcript_44953/g.113061  ORF Transcript_44953/g.113061 Transcript_44953/m.113061 type:complete len:781 (-) Transcript_44953:446-2788(-)